MLTATGHNFDSNLIFVYFSSLLAAIYTSRMERVTISYDFFADQPFSYAIAKASPGIPVTILFSGRFIN